MQPAHLKALPNDVSRHYVQMLDSCADVRSTCAVLGDEVCDETFYKGLLARILPTLRWKDVYHLLCARSLVHIQIVAGPYRATLSCPVRGFHGRRVKLRKPERSRKTLRIHEALHMNRYYAQHCHITVSLGDLKTTIPCGGHGVVDDSTFEIDFFPTISWSAPDHAPTALRVLLKARLGDAKNDQLQAHVLLADTENTARAWQMLLLHET